MWKKTTSKTIERREKHLKTLTIISHLTELHICSHLSSFFLFLFFVIFFSPPYSSSSFSFVSFLQVCKMTKTSLRLLGTDCPFGPSRREWRADRRVTCLKHRYILISASVVWMGWQRLFIEVLFWPFTFTNLSSIKRNLVSCRVIYPQEIVVCFS